MPASATDSPQSSLHGQMLMHIVDIMFMHIVNTTCATNTSTA